VLAALAARTRRLRLATTSLLLPLHHPLRVAAETATLDALSGGRLWLGLGRGFRAPAFEGFEVEAARKRDRFDEALDALLAAWSGEPVTLAGAHFAARDGARLRVGLRPVQRPHPPLVVAAFGRKGLLQAARRGLPYLASPLETLAALAQNYALWRDHREGDAAPAVRAPVMRTVFVAGDDAEAESVRAPPRRGRSRPARRPRSHARRKVRSPTASWSAPRATSATASRATASASAWTC
jgi:alkanesulfonate monooxygenase SsuD/methylene tetrahydromethanopterin reductase-like flavin-dependent oxidoreductase (luciferase family)